MSAFKRLQDISFPAWPRKCVYRWLIGAEVRLRTLHRDAVETFHARRSLPQRRASGFLLQPGPHPLLTVANVRLTDTMCPCCSWNIGSGHLGFLDLVIVHVCGYRAGRQPRPVFANIEVSVEELHHPEYKPARVHKHGPFHGDRRTLVHWNAGDRGVCRAQRCGDAARDCRPARSVFDPFGHGTARNKFCNVWNGSESAVYGVAGVLPASLDVLGNRCNHDVHSLRRRREQVGYVECGMRIHVAIVACNIGELLHRRE